ncbi:MAG TPA: isoprenylcysteine carboxylmethyltransferase family protein [Myxococcota bacterium]|nr:isoprenylcysteine carboxylmethyltransferase family protein [Myxococcota bacterium]
MPGVIRHALAIAVLPMTVTILVPIWLTRRWPTDGGAFPDSFLESLSVAAGLVFLGLGAGLFAACLRRFAGEGDGTLAPWDPPRVLVVRGPYRYVRNPMITGVIAVLLGEALVLRSLPLCAWALAFTALNLVYIPLVEEPDLERRFGDSYRRYCEHVPRIVPRSTPWSG